MGKYYVEGIHVRIPKRELKGMSGTVPEPVGIGNPEKGVESSITEKASPEAST